VLRGHERHVSACAFNPAGDQVVSGSWDNTLRLWQVGRGSSGDLIAQAVLRGHESTVMACAFNPAGDQVVSGSEDNTLRLWQVGRGSSGDLSAQAVLRGHEHWVTACAFNPAGDQVVSAGGYDNTLRLWDIRDIHAIRCVQVVRWFSGVTSITLHHKAHRSLMVVGDHLGMLSVWELADGQLRFVGMPPQPGMANIWRATWKTVKLSGAQVTGPVKALLEQYREEKLKEGVGKNQVRLLKPSSLAPRDAVPAGSGTLAAQGGMFAQPKSAARSPHNPNKRMQQALESSPRAKRLKRSV
jgi:WD40 repeat protein